MTEISPRAEYDSRLARWRIRIAELDRRHLLLSNVRLIIGGAGAVLLWMAFVRASIAWPWPIVAWLGFGAVAVVHARLLNQRERARAAERLYLRGLDRLAGRWPGAGRDGAGFIADHPYAGDLDLFGRGSLFELLNTARTEIGEATLADWLRVPAPTDDVRPRQGAVDELRTLIEFREDVAVLASESPVGRTGPLAAWAGSQPVGFPEWHRVLLAATAAAMVGVAAAVYAELVASVWLIIWLLVVIAVESIGRRRISHVLHAIETPERDLGLLAELLGRVERERFKSPRLVALQQTFVTDGVPPSRRIAQLRSLVSWLDSTHNLMFSPIAYVLLVRPQLAVAIDRWHHRYGRAVAEWLRAVGELEALSALGTYAFEQPDDPFPELVEVTATDGGRYAALYDAVDLRHPLMPGEVSVANDVRLGDSGPRVLIVSGSNMSGKSTLLRSVGVSVVMALAGAPVRATRLRLSPLVLGATLHIEDSLQAGHSRFYAEILRIRTIVDAGRGRVPLLFLLDEILHGTNSYDRRAGAEGIVRALVAMAAIGLVTTHDLALTELTSKLGSAAVNMHFEDRLENGRMIFDYRMRPGVVEHSNALALMRAIGLDV
ncbi:MAG TPA: hypothetical protein VGH34_22580 [Vicinamibacterales bacterium]